MHCVNVGDIFRKANSNSRHLFHPGNFIPFSVLKFKLPGFFVFHRNCKTIQSSYLFFISFWEFFFLSSEIVKRHMWSLLIWNNVVECLVLLIESGTTVHIMDICVGNISTFPLAIHTVDARYESHRIWHGSFTNCSVTLTSDIIAAINRVQDYARVELARSDRPDSRFTIYRQLVVLVVILYRVWGRFLIMWSGD